ncbi:MAG: hypothetical protein AB8E15_00205 [Bdellovibrionales bacterium]
MEAYIIDPEFKDFYFDRENILFDLAGIPEISELVPLKDPSDFCYRTQLAILEYYLEKQGYNFMGDFSELKKLMNHRLLFELYNLKGELLFISSNAKKVNSILHMAFEKSWQDLYFRTEDVMNQLNGELATLLSMSEKKKYVFKQNCPQIILEKFGNRNRMSWQGKYGWKISRGSDYDQPVGFLVVSDCKLV